MADSNSMKNDNKIIRFYTFQSANRKAFQGDWRFMEVFWPVGTEKSIPDCGLVEFRIRQVLFHGRFK